MRSEWHRTEEGVIVTVITRGEFAELGFSVERAWLRLSRDDAEEIGLMLLSCAWEEGTPRRARKDFAVAGLCVLAMALVLRLAWLAWKGAA